MKRYSNFSDGLHERDSGELVFFLDAEAAITEKDAEITRLTAEVERLRGALECGVESIELCARAESKNMMGREDLWKKYLTGSQISFIAQANAALEEQA